LTDAPGDGRALGDENPILVLKHCHDKLHALPPALNISHLGVGINFADGPSFRNVRRALLLRVLTAARANPQLWPVSIAAYQK
jgi:hypothetical protein